MKTTAENTKPIWDTIVAIGGGLTIFLQSALSLEFVTWAQFFGGFGLGIFCFIRVYYWIKHNGYKENRPDNPQT